MLDLIIKNATIVDGTGAKPFVGSVGVKDGRIAFVGDEAAKEATEVFDAKGRVLAPGFIDMHSHADTTLAFFPELSHFLMQGVTTFVGGQCGSSPAPIDKYWMSLFVDKKEIAQLTGAMYGGSNYDVKIDEMFELLSRRYGRELKWNTMGDFFKVVEQIGFGANYCPLAGHGTIRGQVMGKDCKRPATDEEIEAMKVYLHAAMKDGCRGVSVGLDYPPGIYSDFRELKAMGEVAAEYDGIFQAHWRKTGLREATPKRLRKIDGITEILEIGLQTGVQVELSHLIPGFDSYPIDDEVMKTAAKRTLEIIEDYRTRGVKVYFDVIPNSTGGLMMINDLVNFFIKWAIPSGSIEQFQKNIAFADYRAEIYKEINAGTYYTINPAANPQWADYITIIRHTDESACGKTIAELAGARGRSELDTALDLLMADPTAKVFHGVQNMNMAGNAVLIDDPHGTIGLDTLGVDMEFTVWQGENVPPNFPNPNTYNGFIRYLTLYKQPTIEATIHKITGLCAEIMGFKDRGVLKEGYAADLIVMDEAKLKTNEDYVDPRVYPEGIEQVWVGGVRAVRDGVPTNAKNGVVLRHTKG